MISIYRKVFIAGCLAVFFMVGIGFSGHDEHEKHRKRQKRHHGTESHSSKDGEDTLKPVDNAAYKAQCNACHFAYQPGLMPVQGWKRILAEPEKHFGESFELKSEDKGVIAAYLESNAAENSASEISEKIVKCLGSQIPTRITTIPYIQKKHKQIDPLVFKRKSVGSLSNCAACHKTAEQGTYDEDSAVIPQ